MAEHVIAVQASSLPGTLAVGTVRAVIGSKPQAGALFPLIGKAIGAKNWDAAKLLIANEPRFNSANSGFYHRMLSYPLEFVEWLLDNIPVHDVALRTAGLDEGASRDIKVGYARMLKKRGYPLVSNLAWDGFPRYIYAGVLEQAYDPVYGTSSLLRALERYSGAAEQPVDLLLRLGASVVRPDILMPGQVLPPAATPRQPFCERAPPPPPPRADERDSPPASSLDDPGQWACILDRLLPSERGSVFVALPETRYLLPKYRDVVVNNKLIKHQLNHLVVVDPDERSGLEHALVWGNHVVRDLYIRAILARGGPAVRDSLVAVVEFGDAQSLDLMADLLEEAGLDPVAEFNREEYPVRADADRDKLVVLRKRFGFDRQCPDWYYELDEWWSPPIFRALNYWYDPDDPETRGLDMYRILGGAQEPETRWRQYEYLRLFLFRYGAETLSELVDPENNTPQLQALLQTALRDLELYGP